MLGSIKTHIIKVLQVSSKIKEHYIHLQCAQLVIIQQELIRVILKNGKTNSEATDH